MVTKLGLSSLKKSIGKSEIGALKVKHLDVSERKSQEDEKKNVQ
jgi:hypothetical protein